MLISDLSSEQLLMLIIPALPNMWALKHAMYHDFPTTQEKYRWMMACVFVPCLAGVAYYFVGRKHASKEKVDIRARLEAERARREEEKAKAGTVLPEAAEENTAVSAPASESAVSEIPASEAAFAVAESSAAPERSAAAPSDGAEPEEKRPAGTVRPGDDWSFGCPDDVRKPQA